MNLRHLINRLSARRGTGQGPREQSDDEGVIHLVMGVSSAGKSSFIESRIRSGVWRDLPVIIAPEIGPRTADELLRQECIVHYNLFRANENDFSAIDRAPLTDPVLALLLQHRHRIKGYLLATHRSEIIKRALLREGVEPHFRVDTGPYPRERVLALLCQVDLDAFHHKWVDFLRDQGIDFEILDSTDRQYAPVASATDMTGVLASHPAVRYSDEEIRTITERHPFEYQRVTLAPGVSTSGHDRRDALRFLGDDLSGQSVLDVGCADGYFCFEAEKRGASRVVGTEVKPHRFIGANILKEILGMRTELLLRDIFSDPLQESFDTVLFLNVIHHVKEPVSALLTLARLCRKRLIVEFPTLSDSKFRATLPERSAIDPDLPLIGVSLLTSQDQTFLFSPPAIERILLDHTALFSKITFEPSPLSPERCVAICHK
ncbi:class I SAM-dependent methyltransferase [Thioalkalivibrio thiocyanodenitrificans]|uniref:class I SAM-dependent methyltransferase n=1 Tax=Thioalkalivibrio thiocyanodenitrificans TaxID=243063 RepID=UPI000370436D|nr:DUF1698 domain-containing protein [Thioalkalivibrio thiocyanodenitrificans]